MTKERRTYVRSAGARALAGSGSFREALARALDLSREVPEIRSHLKVTRYDKIWPICSPAPYDLS
jgi:hypothetical protein